MNRKKTKQNVVVLAMIVVLSMAMMNCTNDVPTGSTQNGRATGELYASIYYSSESDNLAHLTKTFSKYEVEIIASYLIQTNVIEFAYLTNITFNPDLITGDSLMNLLNEDPVIRWTGLTPNWSQGDVTISLAEGNSEEVIEDFLLSYAEYEMGLNYVDRLSDRIRVTFNYNLVNNLLLLNMLDKDPRVNYTSIDRQIPEWEQGEILVFLCDPSLLEEFVTDYDEQIQKYSYQNLENTNQVFVALTFDHHEIDEFDFLLIIQNDHRVVSAEFNLKNYDF